MNPVIIGVVLFLMSVAIIELIRHSFGRNLRVDRAKTRKRLRKYSYVKNEAGDASSILKKRLLSEIPFVDRLLWHIPGIRAIDRLVVQANAGYPIGFYVLLTLLLTVTAFSVLRFVKGGMLIPLLVAVFVGALPYLWLRSQKRKRMKKFKRQLPEGLGLIARSMKAGNALTTGMKLAADEFDDPLGPELNETLDEINFGVSVPEALKNLAGRVDCSEIKYFVVAIIIQRESGGNLAELMEKLADLIRQKFTFQGKIRALSAEGKLSAIILTVLPFFILGAVMLTSPDYMMPLFTEPIGKILMGGAAVLIVLGIVIMKKMVKIEI